MTPHITPREKQVLNLIAYEHSSKEIANRLHVSPQTVMSHRKNMMEKLGVRNTAGLVRVAFERGLMRVGQLVCIVMCLLAIDLSAQTPDFHIEGGQDVLFGDSMTFAGKKMIWLSDKGGFRAGSVDGNRWDYSSIGVGSAAFGGNNQASGSGSMAWGIQNVASEEYSTAWGYTNNAPGEGSTVWGVTNTASGYISTAWGENSRASAYGSTAWGQSNAATGAEATAWGAENIASGRRSTAWGFRNKSQSLFETVIGRYADTLTTSAENAWQSRDQLFAIGNGTSNTNRQNAFTVLKEGKIGIKTNRPSTDLHIKQIANSEFNGIRLESSNSGNHWTTFYNPAGNYAFYYNSAGAALIQPNGTYVDLVSFREDDSSTKSNLAVLDNIKTLKPILISSKDKSNQDAKWALEVKSLVQAFPETIPEIDGRYGIIYDYFGVIAIKAIQEQQAIIDAQNEKIETGQKEIASLQLENQQLQNIIKTFGERLEKLEGTTTQSIEE